MGGLSGIYFIRGTDLIEVGFIDLYPNYTPKTPFQNITLGIMLQHNF